MTSPASAEPASITFTNALLILPTHAIPVPGSLTFSPITGVITSINLLCDSNSSSPVATPQNPTTTTTIDLDSSILSPGLIDLHHNGLLGIHYTNLSPTTSLQSLTTIASAHAAAGCTAFYATIPTVAPSQWQQLLPLLAPRQFVDETTGRTKGAELLGAHVEGPYLCPAKKGAHDSSLFVLPPTPSASASTSKPASASESTSTSRAGPEQHDATNEGSHEVTPLAGTSTQPTQPTEQTLTPEDLYGEDNLRHVVKMITLSPALPHCTDLITHLHTTYPDIVLSMGHTTATYAQAAEAVRRGVRMVTHTFNAMNGLTAREPGVAGFAMTAHHQHSPDVHTPTTTGGHGGGAGSSDDANSDADADANADGAKGEQQRPGTTTTTTINSPNVDDEGSTQAQKHMLFYSIIADNVHLHPSTLSLALTSGLDPNNLGGGRCIGITDAVELAGLPDGVYEGNGQIKGRQVKEGAKVTMEGSGVLVGGAGLVDGVVGVLRGVDGAPDRSGRVVVGNEGKAEAVREMDKEEEEEEGKRWVRAVKAVSQNVANSMGDESRGRLGVGRRADFVVFGWGGEVRETWVGGQRVFRKG